MRKRSILVLIAACALSASATEAQGPASLWLGVGRTFRDSASISLRSSDISIGLQLSVPLFPVAFRGEAIMASSDVFDGPRSWLASAVIPLKLPMVQPYAIGGYGIYSRGTPSEEKGFSFGAGARVGVARLGLFGELRRHPKLDRTTATLGITL